MLLVCALLGQRVGADLSRSHRLPNGIVTLSVVTALTSSVFFLWALVNTVTGGNLDGGCISFPLALAASVYGYGLVLDVTRWGFRVAGVAGYAAVACNYAYIISVVGGDLGAAFLLYLCIGAIYWGCAAILATCVDVVPKSLAPGAGSGAAYTPIPGGGIRV